MQCRTNGESMSSVDDPTAALIATAKAAYKAGFSILPPRHDGTKAPAVPEWKQYQSERADSARLKTWYLELHHTGIGYVTGRLSNLECFEFDDAGTYEEFREAAEAAGLGELVHRIEAGYSDRTPSGGVHWYYRCSEIGENEPLARRPLPDRPTFGAPLIETRGEGGYVIAAPSFGTVHPSRQPYELLHGGPASITAITPADRADLFAMARSFDEMPPRDQTPPPKAEAGGDKRPGDVFEERATWDDILTPHGWTRTHERHNGETLWRRPGKDRGVSASENWRGYGCLRVFTSSTVLEPKMYRKFTAYTVLNHGGDAEAAARELVRQGYAPPASADAGGDHPSQREAVDRVPMLVTLSDVEAQDIEWLWQSWLPRRMLAILGGYGGDGKSTLLAFLMAHLSRGGMMPDGTRAPLTNCLLLAAEDDPQYALRPRLDLHNADVSRIHLLKGTRRENGLQEWLDLKRDADIMRGIIRAYDIGLVAIDPLSSYMPKADRNSEGDVRDALMPLQQLMEDTGVAVIGVMHVGKADAQRRAAQRLLGSTAFTALARTVWMVHDLPEGHQPKAGPDDSPEKLKVLGVAKANYSIPPPPLVFSRPPDGPLRWHGHSPVTIEEAFDGGPKRTTLEDAEEWLADYLKGGMRPSVDAEEAAKRRGFSEKTYKRARASLDVRTHRDGSRWYIHLPAGSSEEIEGGQPCRTHTLTSCSRSPANQEGQTENMTLFPESRQEGQTATTGPLASNTGDQVEGGQSPYIDNLAPFHPSQREVRDSDPLPPTGTEGLPEWEV